MSVESNGVTIAGQRLVVGPLAVEHKYQIILEITEPQQGWRTGVEVAPIHQPQTTRPAGP